MISYMKKLIVLCAAILAFASIAKAQNSDDAKSVLRTSREKCLSIQHGHYVMEYWKKNMSHKDTTMGRCTCDFKKLPDDTIYGKAFALFEERSNWSWSPHYLYTGNEFVWYADSVGEVLSCDRWIGQIIAGRSNCKFYSALTDQFNYPFPSDKDLADNAYTYFITETTLDGKSCYMVDILQKMDEEVESGLTCIRYEAVLWINKKDYLPMQYSIVYDMVEGQDTMHQYDLFKLLAFDTVFDESRLTMESIPAEVKLKDYVPYTPPEPIVEGTSAPDWSLPTLAGDTVRLADLRGKIVLIDFFYKSCIPCCAALPALQNLHKKYKDHGFVMIGIDPYDDTKKDEMADFLAKRSITYTVLFSDRELPEAYHVSSYPTLFFINRKGKIVKVKTGFSKTMEDEIEKQLLKML